MSILRRFWRCAINTMCSLILLPMATFPRLGARVWAERIVPVASDVKISWNGATKETQESIMLGSNWEMVLDNVKNFIDDP